MEPKRIDLQVSDKGIFVINFPCAVGGFAAHTNSRLYVSFGPIGSRAAASDLRLVQLTCFMCAKRTFFIRCAKRTFC